MASRSNDAIVVGYGDEAIELTGDAKDEFLADRERMDAEKAAAMAEINLKKVAVLEKLEKLGLTEEELRILLV